MDAAVHASHACIARCVKCGDETDTLTASREQPNEACGERVMVRHRWIRVCILCGCGTRCDLEAQCEPDPPLVPPQAAR